MSRSNVDRVEVVHVHDAVAASLEDDVEDRIVDVGVARFQDVAGDVPGLPDTSAHHTVQADPVDDHPVDVLDHRVAALEAEHDDVPASPGSGDGRIERGGGAAHLDGHVDAHTAGEVVDLLRDGGVVDVALSRGLRRGDDRVGPQSQSHVPVALHRLDPDDRARPQSPCHCHCEKADGTQADDGYALPAQVDFGAGVHGIPERLLQHRDLRPDLPDVGGPEGLCGQLHQLAEAAVEGDADDLGGGAHVPVADAALVAGVVDDMALCRHDVTGSISEISHGLRADFHYLAQEFVAHDPHVAAFLIEGRRDHVAEAAPVPDASVGTAEPGEKWSHQDHGAVVVVPIDVEDGSRHRLKAQTGRCGPRILDTVVGQRTHGLAHRQTPVGSGRIPYIPRGTAIVNPQLEYDVEDLAPERGSTGEVSEGGLEPP